MEREELLGVLGLSGSPTPTEIKAAHRAQSKRHHPDVGGSDHAMATINLAVNELLTNPPVLGPQRATTMAASATAAATTIRVEPADDPQLWSLLVFFVGVPVVLIGTVMATVAVIVGL